MFRGELPTSPTQKEIILGGPKQTQAKTGGTGDRARKQQGIKEKEQSVGREGEKWGEKIKRKDRNKEQSKVRPLLLWRLEFLTWLLLNHHPCYHHGQEAWVWNFWPQKHSGHFTARKSIDYINGTTKYRCFSVSERVTFTCRQCLWNGGTADQEWFQQHKTWGKKNQSSPPIH